MIGEITCPHLIIVLNKIDLLPPSTRDSQIERVIFYRVFLNSITKLLQLKKKFSRTLENTLFSDVPIVSVAARPGGADAKCDSEGVDRLVEVNIVCLIAHIFFNLYF